MELNSSSFPLLFSFILLLVMVFNKVNKKKTQNPPSKLPPGPWKLPIIGNMHQFLGPLPHHTLRDLANQHGPLMHLMLGEVSTIVVSSSGVAEEVMKTYDLNFANRGQVLAAKIMTYGYVDIAFSPYGNYWRQLKKICILELLSAKRVESFRSIREEEISNIVHSIFAKANSPINLTEKLSMLTNNIIAKAAFGKKCEEQAKFILAMKEVTKMAGGFNVADLFPSFEFVSVISGIKYKLENAQRKIDSIFEAIIEEHRRTSQDWEAQKNEHEEEEDFIDVLLRLQQHGGLDFPITINTVKAIIVDMFTGGTDTSSTLMDWVMAELMRNPSVMEKAQREVRMVFIEKGEVDEKGIGELNYLKSVVKETLRLHPPVPLLIPRECREKCEIAGYEIPTKTRVIVNAWAIGRDPQHWDDPETFKPERFDGSSVDFKGANFEFIPFGAGRRICPGISFGLANAVFPLAQLLYYFNWNLPSGMKPEDLDMTENFGAIMDRRSDLYLVPVPFINLPRE